jgi:hypothetical protein
MFNIKIATPSTEMVQQETINVHQQFRLYYYKKKRCVHKLICTANNGFLLQSTLHWKIIDSFYDTLNYKILNEKNIREFFMYFIQTLLKKYNLLLNDLRDAYQLLRKCKLKGNNSRAHVAKERMLKKRYEEQLRDWNKESLTYVTVRSMLPSINEHIKQEIMWSKEVFLKKQRKRYNSDLRLHKHRMRIVFDEMYLAWDAIKFIYQRR